MADRPDTEFPRGSANRAVTQRAFNRTLEGFGDILLERLAAIETRLKKLEQAPQVKYLGAFQQDVQYPEGSLVTLSGGLWIATARSIGCRPGESAASWRLIVKSGHAPR